MERACIIKNANDPPGTGIVIIRHMPSMTFCHIYNDIPARPINNKRYILAKCLKHERKRVTLFRAENRITASP